MVTNQSINQSDQSQRCPKSNAIGAPESGPDRRVAPISAHLAEPTFLLNHRPTSSRSSMSPSSCSKRHSGGSRPPILQFILLLCVSMCVCVCDECRNVGVSSHTQDTVSRHDRSEEWLFLYHAMIAKAGRQAGRSHRRFHPFQHGASKQLTKRRQTAATDARRLRRPAFLSSLSRGLL